LTKRQTVARQPEAGIAEQLRATCRRLVREGDGDIV
jgi:hypothetical protein